MTRLTVSPGTRPEPPTGWLDPARGEIMITPVGGVGRIGMNMTVYGSAGRHLIVDAGVAFMPPLEAEKTGIRSHTISPATFDGLEGIEALVVTHAHEDHIGGVLDLLMLIDVPVYLTPLAESLLRRKARDRRFPYPLGVVSFQPGEEFRIGPFLVASCRVSHSVPEACSLFIVADGMNKGVLHTGDYNMDHGGPLGCTDVAFLEKLGNAGVVGLVVGDSTNAGRDTSSSEVGVHEAFRRLMSQSEGAVYVAGFASNLGRMLTFGHAAVAAGRTPALAGASMLRFAEAGWRLGYFDGAPEFAARDEMGALPKNRRAMMLTGIQGEPLAALAQMLDGAAGYPDVGRGDVLVLSGRTLDGNMAAMNVILDGYRRAGVRVILASDGYDGFPVHASGHASRGEIAAYYGFAKPDMVMPVHGEPQHLASHAELAAELGLACVVPEVGTIYALSRDGLRVAGRVAPIVMSHRVEEPFRAQAPSWA